MIEKLYVDLIQPTLPSFINLNTIVMTNFEIRRLRLKTITLNDFWRMLSHYHYNSTVHTFSNLELRHKMPGKIHFTLLRALHNI